MTEERIKIAKEKNKKIYPIYKMFSWDLLFYYSIIFLFLNQAKGLTASQVFFADAFYPIFKILFQPFVPMIINIIGKRKANIIGNIFVAISILTIILLEGSVLNYIISLFVMAIGYIIKGTCESCILKECIEDNKEKNDIFSKIDSRGSTYYYIFDAISAITTGFLFVINPYIPMYLCFVFCIIAILIAFKFENYEEKREKTKKKEHSIKTLSKKLNLSKQEYIFIFKSKRLRALILFSTLFYAVLYIRSTISSNIFVDIGISNNYFGIITAVFAIFSAIATWKQEYFQNKFKNRLLTFFSLTYSITFILIGIIVNLNINYSLTIICVLLMMIIQNMMKAPFYTFIKRYKNSFFAGQMSVKIYSVCELMNALGAMIVSFAVSILLEHTTTVYATLIIGIVSFVLFIGILEYMKTRVGLKPEEYKKEEIEFMPKERKKENVLSISVGIDEKGETIIKLA